MQSTCKFPSRVTVRAQHQFAEGLAVRLCFEMKEKNNYYYTVFLGPDGCAEITGDQLLLTFNEDRVMFMSDYIDLLSGFTGRITAKALSISELRDAIKASESFSHVCSFPIGYSKNLTAALARGQDTIEIPLDMEID